jgi:adenosylhomocysteine nucleosidase
MKRLSAILVVVVLLALVPVVQASQASIQSSHASIQAAPTPAATPVAQEVEYKAIADATPRVAVESAFDAELALLLGKTTDKKPYVINGRTFTIGKLAGHDAVLVLSGGSIYNSALTTQMLFDYFNVTQLVFSGIAGGVNDRLNIGDVVVGKQSAEYMELLAARENSDGTYLLPDWFQPSLPNFGIFFPQPNYVVQKGGKPDAEAPVRWFPADPDMLKVAANVATKVTLNKCGLDINGTQVCLSTQPKIVVGGNLVNGPVYMDNSKFRHYVYYTFKADALAMEDVYHACYVNAKKCIMFRSLSDLAGGGPGENEINTFFRIAADNSAMVVHEFLTELK